jgi:hypothetical protein
MEFECCIIVDNPSLPIAMSPPRVQSLVSSVSPRMSHNQHNTPFEILCINT